jgi:hypothetical protein
MTIARSSVVPVRGTKGARRERPHDQSPFGDGEVPLTKRLWPTLVAAALLMVALTGVATATTPGTWEAYPGQSTASTTTVQQPINADGSSNFKANGKAVIPVKFSLATGTGPLVFESIFGDASTDNDFSFVSYTPSAPLLFSGITELSAVYAFTTGNCHGGSLRWSVRVSPTQSVFIYYGDYPNFTDCSGANNQSNVNMINMSDLRFDTSQVGGTFYDNYAGALALVGNLPITRATLVLDSGWGGNQRLTLSSATVNGNTFTPASASTASPTCNLPAATIEITKTDGVPSGVVNEPTTIQPNDSNDDFRIVDCKYMYNLATSSLSGVGTYTVSVVINGVPASNPAVFDLK